MKKQWWQRDFIYLVESSATQTYEEAFIEHRDDLKDPKVAYLGDPTDEAIQDLEHLNVQYKSVKIKYAIQYRTSNGQPIYINNTSSDSTTGWGAVIVSNTYSNGIGEIEFNTEFHNIAQEAFSGQTALTEIYIPSQVTSVLDGAFYNCSSLAVCELPYTVEEIDSMAFNGCSSLVAFNMPSSLTTLGTMAFAGCSSLRMVVVPATVTDMGTGVFSDCTGLTGTTIQNGISAITMNTFDGCYSLEYVRIPDSVQTIGQSAFTQCSQLTGVEIGTGLTSVGNYAFCGCSQLVNIWISATTAPSFTLGNTFSGVGMYGTLAFPEGSDYSSWLSTTQHGLGYYHWNASPYLKQPLTFVAKQDNTVVSFNRPTTSTSATYSISNKLQYSTDNGTTWTPLTGSSTATALTFPTLSSGQTLQVKAADNTSGPTVLANSAPTSASNSYIGLGRFQIVGFANVEGNVMSLVKSGTSFIEETTIPTACTFAKLFSGCTGLTNIENLVLPATSLRDACYFGMFINCANIIKPVKELPATTIPASGYAYMFSSSNIFTPPSMTATTVNNKSMWAMFNNCPQLTTAPELPATTLAEGCYRGMFSKCPNLGAAPLLTAATELKTECYALMFCGDTKINYIKMTGRYSTASTSQYYATNTFCGWTYGVSGTGIFVKHGLMLTIPEDSASGIPVGWTMHILEGTEYLTMRTNSNGNTLGFRSANLYAKFVSATTDNGYTWFKMGATSAGTLASGSTTLNANTNIAFKATGLTASNPSPTTNFSSFTYTSQVQTFGCGHFTLSSSSYPVRIIGNPLSLVYGDNFYGQTVIPSAYTFAGMFCGIGDSTGKSDIILPATTLNTGCYMGMFWGCGSANVRELPATALTDYCYSYMFYNNSYITPVSNLPAETPRRMCYAYMYYDCYYLDQQPEISLTSTTSQCCYNMFAGTQITEATLNPFTSIADNALSHMYEGCTKLTTAPELPATTIQTSGCAAMFYGCTKLVNVEDMSATTIGNGGCAEMFRGCTSLKKAPLLDISSVPTAGCYAMYSGCTSLSATQPTIASTSVGASGCSYMFCGCSSLDTLPQLPAGSLSNSAYSYMFSACTKATTAPDLTATTVPTAAYAYMFSNCSKLTSVQPNENGILPAIGSNLGVSCYEGMFQSCSTLVNAPVLPSGTIPERGYAYMFRGCTSLTPMPDLTGTSLGIACYSGMFSSCTSLSAAKDLTATTLAESCYTFMFAGCISANFKTGPVVCGSTLAKSCYYGMFAHCTNLITAATKSHSGTRALGANIKTANTYCYAYMYSGCTRLASVPSAYLPSSALSSGCYAGMFCSCSNSAFTSAPLLNSTAVKSYSYQKMFALCSKLSTTQSSLPSTTLDTSCYAYMYSSCTSLSLSNAPNLPAETLATSAYNGMFMRCTNFTGIKSMASLTSNTIPAACCQSMYEGCTNIASASQTYIPGTTIQTSGCARMFSGCTNLTSFTGTLSAATLGSGCYREMFNFCTKLKSAPIVNVGGDGGGSIPLYGCYAMFANCIGITGSVTSVQASSVGSSGCEYMFSSCTYLTGVTSAMAATELSDSCYYGMFSGCTRLVTTPLEMLPAATVPSSGYYAMFAGCSALTDAPMLPATTVGSAGYYQMFHSCTSLTIAPALPAASIANNCYGYMFWGCSSLGQQYETLARSSFQETGGVINSETKKYNQSSTWNSIIVDCEKYAGGTLSFSATGTSFIFLTAMPVFGEVVSPAGGATGLDWNNTASVTRNVPSDAKYFYICTHDASAVRPVSDLSFSSPNFTLPATSVYASCYSNMFQECTSLNAKFELPAAKLANYCYANMFCGCTSLISAATIQATTLASDCCVYMFCGCTNLVSATTLLPTTLSEYCYRYMFYGCKSLAVPPVICATTLASHCCDYMFTHCSALTSSPVLKATSLTSYCYQYMFQYCSSLVEVTCLAENNIPTGSTSSDPTYQWLNGVSSSGVFHKSPNAYVSTGTTGKSWKRNTTGIPSNWTYDNYTS